jgi:hypothetical protein
MVASLFDIVNAPLDLQRRQDADNIRSACKFWMARIRCRRILHGTMSRPPGTQTGRRQKQSRMQILDGVARWPTENRMARQVRRNIDRSRPSPIAEDP